MKPAMSVLGIDIAKRVFHAVGMDERGKIVLRKRLSRHDLMPFMAKLPPVLIGMEACGVFGAEFVTTVHPLVLLSQNPHVAS
jgi:transposase